MIDCDKLQSVLKQIEQDNLHLSCPVPKDFKWTPEMKSELELALQKVFNDEQANKD